MGEKREMRWFIEHRNDYTKKIICDALETFGLPTKSEVIRDSNNESHVVWEVNKFTIYFLQRTKIQGDKDIDFAAFLEMGKIIRRYRLHEIRSSIKKSKIIRRIRKLKKKAKTKQQEYIPPQPQDFSM